MRKNTGMAYKRRQRNAHALKARDEILRLEKRDYRGCDDSPVNSVGLSFEEYIEESPWVSEQLRGCGRYSKSRLYAGEHSTVYLARFWWRYYTMRDIKNAIDAASEYDEYNIPDDVVNRSEALRKAHDADRKKAKHRKMHC